MRTPLPLRRLCCGLLLAFAGVFAASGQEEGTPVRGALAPTEMADQPAAATRLKVVVIPVRDAIDTPILYVLRRGLKEAIENEADLVALDMDTPGGRADVMLDIMEALDRFPGGTLTFVNDEAGSAGALIAAVTDEIYFAPNAVMGAAELIASTGADVPEALKRKMTSYINAKVRALSDSDPRRAEVLKAMTSADFELKIDDEVLKREGELLTVTADEAMKPYGDPPTPLLGAGIAADITALLDAKLGAGNYDVTRLETTWSEDLAALLNTISPVLMGLGLLGLFIEFKTPGFGVFGILGGAFLVVVFLSQYVAGLSGHEPMVFFGVGVLLVLAEVVFFPGVVVMALTGLLLMLGSLVWSMADLWPDQPVEWSGDVFTRPLIDVALGVVIAVFSAAAILRFLPRGMFWDKLILAASVGTGSRSFVSVDSDHTSESLADIVGKTGVTMTALFPTGYVKIDGRWYLARVEVGTLETNQEIVVRRRGEFDLIVEPIGGEEAT